MIVCILAAAVIFAALYFKEHMKYKGMNRELAYINKRLDEISCTAEREFVLVPSDNEGIKLVAAGLNRLLQNFYTQRAGYINKEEAMKNVLTNIAHDLRTPLTVLKGYSEVLNTKASYENLSGMLSKIDEKTDELTAAVEEYFTISKIESGDMKLEIEEINISQLVHEVVLDYYELLEKEGFETVLQIENQPVCAMADAEALGRIVKNLIDNAIKHGGSGKYFAIRLKKEASRALIEIEDHGEGIPNNECERIFDRNYTADQKRGGSGLGLAIAKGLAAEMNADIQVYSVPMEKTVFTVSLRCIS